MASVSSTITGYVSHHCDGSVGIEYYTSGYAFSWNGDLFEPIEISYGGYGEPVTHIIDLTGSYLTTPYGLKDALVWFKTICDLWLDTEGLADVQVAAVDTVSSAARQHYIDTGVYPLVAGY